ncbi:MAG: hypothetical protein M3378_11465, partial [Actinomycetota bacterium]|nr:hypothetical protein [Actinomycetota bacterium]
PTTTTMAPTTTTMAPTTTTTGGGQTVALRVTVAPTCITPGAGLDILVESINSAGNVVTTETRAVEGTVNGQPTLTGWSGNFLDHTPAGQAGGIHRFDPDHGGPSTFGADNGAGWALNAATSVAPGNYQIGAFIASAPSISGSTTLQVANVCAAGAAAEPASATTTGTAIPTLLGVGLLVLASLPLPEAAAARMLRRRKA